MVIFGFFTYFNSLVGSNKSFTKIVLRFVCLLFKVVKREIETGKKKEENKEIDFSVLVHFSDPHSDQG